ncbi:hypothetical protein ABK040_004300 [Willaertia magna]
MISSGKTVNAENHGKLMTGFLVTPKRDCPHINNEHVNLPEDEEQIKSLVSGICSKPCKDCEDISENWFCLKCHSNCCSRYVNGHMAKHFEEENHSIVLSLADLSLYCYECDSYIETPNSSIRTLRKEVHKEKFGLYPGEEEEKEETVEEKKVEISSDNLQAIEILAEKIKNIDDESIIVLTGAGLSTASGIPDFRTPGTGLYDNLERYNLPHATAIFELSYFEENPKPFFELSRDFISKGYKPSKAHYFIKLLEEKGRLLRLYTQNIDGLEAKSGVSKDKLVNCHGMYDTAHCINEDCKEEYDLAFVKEAMGDDENEIKVPLCKKCGSYVKPDIVLFGESLPDRYAQCLTKDLLKSSKCKLLIIIGTSLKVYPVAAIPNFAPNGSTRCLINREKCGPFTTIDGNVREGVENSKHNAYTDLFIGEELSIDESVEKLVELLDWKEELEELYKKGPIDLVEQSKKHEK